MNLDVNIVSWGLSVLPIVVLLTLMVKFQWGAAEATPIALAVALSTGIFYFGASLDLLAVESAKGIWNALIVLIVIWPAILIFEVTDEAGGFNVFRVGMQKFTPNELLQVIAIGWVFVSFLQGITGFGVPVAVGAPLLVGIGVTPLWAVVVPLLGHAWGNTFGTLSVAWQSLILQTGLEDPTIIAQVAFWAATFLWMFNFITGVTISWFYGKFEAVKKGLPAVIVISTIQGGGQLLLSQVNPTISAFLSCCIALGAVFILGKTKWYNKPWKMKNSPIMNKNIDNDEKTETQVTNMSLNQAFVPYYSLTFITLIILLISPIKNYLGQLKLFFSFKETSTALGIINPSVEAYSPFSPLTHAGVFLLLSALIGFAYFRKINQIEKNKLNKILMRTVDKTVPSTIAVVGLIIMSKIMGGTGQIEVLAVGTANVMGRSYTLVAALVGMLGSFMTSSNMASNILFGKFQMTTSQILKLPIQPILGAQTAGGAIGNTISPGNVILGTTTAGILGQEGKVLKKILPIALFSAVLCGILIFVFILVS